MPDNISISNNVSDIIEVNDSELLTIEQENVELIEVGIVGPASTIPGPKGDFPYSRESHVLTAQDIVNKYVALNNVPQSLSNVSCFIKNGNHGFIGADYSISGQYLYWEGYQWDGLLEEGDEIEIYYASI